MLYERYCKNWNVNHRMRPRVITRQKKARKATTRHILSSWVSILVTQWDPSCYTWEPPWQLRVWIRWWHSIQWRFFFFFANHGFIATHLISDAVLERQERCSSRIDILPFLNTSTHSYNPLAPICESKQVCSILLHISRVITPANHKHMMMLAAPLLYKQINLHECYKCFLSN